MRLKDRVKWLERKLAEVESETLADIARLEYKVELLVNRSSEPARYDETATCHICGKRDFMDNLADVKWLEREEWDKFNIGTMQVYFAHPSCAKIHRSDDGKGWVKDCKCKGKK